MEQAEANGVLNDKVNYYGDFDLLMTDDFGMMTLEMDASRNLFEVIDARYPGKSTMIVSPFAIEEWYDFFKNNIYAEACLGRLITGQPRLTMDGKSMC